MNNENELFEQWYLANYQSNFDIQGETNAAMLLHKAGLIKSWQARAELAEKEIAELQAQINELRKSLQFYANKQHMSLNGTENGIVARKALAKTAPQCLKEHDNEG